MSLNGEIVKEWLRKWPKLPTTQLSRMIYTTDNNNLLFPNMEAVRTLIRYYRHANGDEHRKAIATKEFARPFKTIQHE